MLTRVVKSSDLDDMRELEDIEVWSSVVSAISEMAGKAGDLGRPVDAGYLDLTEDMEGTVIMEFPGVQKLSAEDVTLTC